MNPTLYDILGVRPDASAEEIKRAWRDSADRFEPGSGASGAQFRLFNEAAEVLLDPQRRREYDEQLRVEERERPAAQPAGVSGPAGATPGVVSGPVEPPASRDTRQDTGGHNGTSLPEGAVRQTAAPGAAAQASGGSAPAGSGASLWAIVTAAVLALVVLVLVGVAAWFGLVQWNFREVRRSSAVADARTASTATAERAAAVILSYDYKTLDADEKAAERYMTSDYAKKYAKTFDKLVRGNATDLHAHVEADVRASGVVNADPDRSAVLLFVDQTTVSKANDGQKQTALNRVEMKMVRQGGRWLVNDITSY